MAGSRIEGQLQQYSIDPGDTFSLSLRGSLSGDHISLVAGSHTFTGTLTSDVLTIVIPASDGSLQTATLRRGSVRDFNRAAAALESERDAIEAASAAAEAARVAREQAAEAARIARAKAAADLEAQRLAATKEQNCGAINGYIDPDWEWSCASGVQGDNAPDCALATVSFNPDGTLWRGSLEIANLFNPGCFPRAADVPSTVAN